MFIIQILLLIIQFIGFINGVSRSDVGRSKCLQRYYALALKLNFIGELASVKLMHDYKYSVMVRFTCPKYFQFGEKWKSSYNRVNVIVPCSSAGSFLNPQIWPVCRGAYENVTCSNEYFYSNTSYGKHWLKETKNLFHANYKPVQKSYEYKYNLQFTCPHGLELHEARGLSVMTTTCKKDGGWTKEWPRCKGNTCSKIFIENAIIKDEDRRYDIGVKLHISCEQGFHLWGSNTTTCKSDFTWSGYPGECVTLEEYQRKCKKYGKKLRYSSNTLECYAEPTKTQPTYSHFKYELAFGIGIPACLAVVVFTIFAILYVRHQRNLFFLRSHNDSGVEGEPRAIYNREMVQLILPTYDEAMESKPTTPPPTFEETFRLDSSSFYPVSTPAVTTTVNDNQDNTERPPAYNDAMT